MTLIRNALTLTAAGAMVALPVTAAKAQVAIDEDAYRLSYTTPWTLDFAENSCAARGLFAGEGREAYLELRQFVPEPVMQITVASDDIPLRLRKLETTFIPDLTPDTEHANAIPITTQEFGEGLTSRVSIMRSSQVDEMRQALENEDVFTFSEEAIVSRAAELEGIYIRNGFNRPLYLQTGPMRELMTVMRSCMDSLMEHWGLDPQAQRNLSRKVQPLDADRWSRELTRRYPLMQLNLGQQAIVNIRLIVSEQGLPADCAVQNSSNEPAFNELACELLMEHSRFEPALDSAGSPVVSFWTTTVIYNIR